jgi:hypothetical protein
MTLNQLHQSGIMTYEKESKPYGLTYGEWTVKWWKWVLLTPAANNPLKDESGVHWNIAQPSSDVYFLAGCVPEIDNGSHRSDKRFPHRNIKMPYGRSILFPVLNCEANSLEYPKLTTHEGLLEHVHKDINSIRKRDAFINGIRLDPVRVQSDPLFFRLTMVEDNIFRVQNPNSTDIIADGYWIFLKPLPRGSYTIQMQGSCEFGRLKSGADYELEIV